MFTGIIEALGKISKIESSGTNKTFTIASPISKELKVDQSVSHNGVCLTVEACDNHAHKLTAIKETLDKSNLGSLEVGDLVNLERSLRPDSLMDGHLVQGHVDIAANCTKVSEVGGSWTYRFSLPEEGRRLVVPKGSICINGVSLTVADLQDDYFEVAIIPYTYEHTTFKSIEPGSMVNIEFDVIGKYVMRYLETRDDI